jgi:hypothetical protein
MKFRSRFAMDAQIAGKPVGSNPQQLRETDAHPPAKLGVHLPETTKQQFP